MTYDIPLDPQGLTPQLLTEIIGDVHPGARVEGVNIVQAMGYGETGVHSSAIATLDLTFAAGSAENLPRRVVVKMSLNFDHWSYRLDAVYELEVNFYNRIRPSLVIEAPLSMGGRYDAESGRYVLVLEDVGARGAHMSTLMDDVSIGNVERVLETLARLHAHFWGSARFRGDLSWVQTHLGGSIERLMDKVVRPGVQGQLGIHRIEREMLERIEMTEEQLYTNIRLLKLHQLTLPQTLLHGDCHIANTYRLPDGSGGLYDWQLCLRGFAIHDVGYHITTALSIEERRRSERDLLAFYRDRLQAYGVTDPPDLETFWSEMRRGHGYGIYVWLTAVEHHYGLEPLMVVLQRLSTAFEDHETRKMLAQLS